VRKTNKKLVGVAVGSALIAIVVWTAFLMSFAPQTLNFFGSVNVELEAESVHATVTFYKEGKLYAEYHHAGVVTDIGDNMTIFWASGDTAFKVSSMLYSWNISHIGIGNQGTLSSASIVLPGEWNRTAITTVDNKLQSTINFTTVIYPDSSGPYTADCIGLYPNATGNFLWAYDTFTEVTGIDETFTITIEFQVSVSHS